MKVKLTIEVNIPTKDWAAEYGVEEIEVPEDFRRYIRGALENLPVSIEVLEVR